MLKMKRRPLRYVPYFMSAAAVSMRHKESSLIFSFKYSALGTPTREARQNAGE
jgi:hypothetical protein